jgi:hypothetical protein
MTDQDRTLCITLSHFMRAAGLCAGALSLLLTGMALLAWLLSPLALAPWGRAAALAVMVLGVVERYLALRVGFDARLFDGLEKGSVASLAALDQALGQLGLRSASAVPRSLHDRVQGARRLVRCHLAVVAVQLVLAGMMMADLV